MEFEEFKSRIQNSIPVGTKLENPGGGVSTITSHKDEKLGYIRGSSTIYVAYHDLFDAYSEFKGGNVTSSSLKEYAPSIFDPKARPAGHSCNCTFLFMVLQQLGLAGNIGGKGVKADPYFVRVAG